MSGSASPTRVRSTSPRAWIEMLRDPNVQLKGRLIADEVSGVIGHGLHAAAVRQRCVKASVLTRRVDAPDPALFAAAQEVDLVVVRPEQRVLAL